MTGLLYWWRVRVDAKGRILECERVIERPIGTDTQIYYVEADDRMGAESAAYRAYKRQQREALEARRERHRAAGLCRCGGKRDGDWAHCKTCREREARGSARAAARARGEEVATISKVEAFAETRERREQGTRLETLLEVREHWQSAANVRVFAKWLNARIQELGGKS